MADTISELILSWYASHKRRLSFRGTGDPYKVLVSEFMLQQTRADTAEAYFDRFVALFPDISSLASAPVGDVLKAWEGLGYYARARNLRQAAVIIEDRYGGRVPGSARELVRLPGVGPYSAAAVASIAFGERIPAMDGNLIRIFARLYDERGCVDREEVKRRLFSLALSAMPERECGDFNQAMMDLGASVCVPGTPDCGACPLESLCLAARTGHPESLPVKSKKKPPAQKYYAAVILRRGERVCLVRRTEKMLNSLYVFLLVPLPGETADGEACAAAGGCLARRFPLLSVSPLGEARHVFTHQVWNMKILLARCDETAPETDGTVLWADREQLLSLPMPGAMKAARSLALQALSADRPED